MVDNVAITAGAGTTIAADDVGAGVLHQRVKATWGPDGTGNDTDTASGKAFPIQLRSSTGEDVIKHEDDASASADPGLVLLAKRGDTPAATSGTDGDYEPLQVKGGRLHVRGEPRAFVAPFGTITRPANVTAYAANDAVSNNATAGSVTSQTASLSDVNDDPILIERLRLETTDTGMASKAFRAWLFNVDPTASTGIVGGDNAAYSTKKTAAGFIGTMSGFFRTFSDGSVAILLPDEGNRIVTKPVSGAMTIYYLLQTLDAFTPSANSTTIIGYAEGVQVRA